MPIALTLEPEEYILQCDREASPEEQSVFHLKPLTYEEKCKLQDSLVYTEQKLGPKDEPNMTQLKSGTWEMNTVLYGLEAIDNLKDQEGHELKYTSSMPKKDRMEILSRLRDSWRQELAEEIRKISALGENETKN